MVYVPILFHLYQIQRAVWSIFPHYIAIQMNTVILFALTLNLTLIKRSHRTQQCSLCERTLGKKPIETDLRYDEVCWQVSIPVYFFFQSAYSIRCDENAFWHLTKNNMKVGENVRRYRSWSGTSSGSSSVRKNNLQQRQQTRTKKM